ncbi:MAG: tetratricopeptide repeat protein [Candidatus Binatia bacterium]
MEIYHASRHHIAFVTVCLALFLCFKAAGALAFKEPDISRTERDRGYLGQPSLDNNRSLSSERLRTVGSQDEIIAAKRERSFIGPNEPLTRAIHPGMSARSVAGLRIAEAGRRLLRQGHFARALVRLERALALNASPYDYYYLALVHYRLGDYQQSLNFLEVAGSRLSGHPEWPAELSALKGLVRKSLRSARVSDGKRDAAVVAAPPAAVSKPKQDQQKQAGVSGDVGESRTRHYLLVFDFFMLSFCVAGFFAAFLLSSLRTLRPRQE